jgi:hypothetical protein
MDPETSLRASLGLTSSLVALAQRGVAAGAPRAAVLSRDRADWELALDNARRASDSFPGDPDVIRFAEAVEVAASEARRSVP